MRISKCLALGLMVMGICRTASDLQASVPPHSFTPIDSVWIERPPELGETLAVFIRFSVHTSYVDSVMLHGASFESRHREPLMDVRRVLQCEMGDTLTRSLGFVFDRPGQYEVHLAVKGWYAQDPSARPTGASTRTLRLAIPDSGYGQVVNRFSQSVSTERKTLKQGNLIFWGDLVITPSGDTLWPTILPADSDVAPDSVDRPEGSIKPRGAVQVVPTLYPLTRIDSIWVTTAPRAGDSVEVSIRFAVPSAYTDSVQVAGSYYAKSERNGHGETSLTIPISVRDTLLVSLPVSFPDTVVTSLNFSFKEPGRYSLIMRVYSWLKTDKTERPQGPSQSVLYFDIPAEGEGVAYTDYLKWTRDTTVRPRRAVEEGQPFRLRIPEGGTLQDADWPIIDTCDSAPLDSDSSKPEGTDDREQ